MTIREKRKDQHKYRKTLELEKSDGSFLGIDGILGLTLESYKPAVQCTKLQVLLIRLVVTSCWACLPQSVRCTLTCYSSKH